MKTFIAFVLVFVSMQAQAATAMWTGRCEFITTVTYQQGVTCEYNLFGNTFWRTFTGALCPMSVEVY